MGLRKSVFATTGGCESSEANPADRGTQDLHGSSAPMFYCVRDLRDPDAETPTLFFGQGCLCRSLAFLCDTFKTLLYPKNNSFQNTLSTEESRGSSAAGSRRSLTQKLLRFFSDRDVCVVRLPFYAIPSKRASIRKATLSKTPYPLRNRGGRPRRGLGGARRERTWGYLSAVVGFPLVPQGLPRWIHIPLSLKNAFFSNL